MRLIDADLLIRTCKKWLEPKSQDEDEMVSLADIAVSVLILVEVYMQKKGYHPSGD